MMVETLDKEQEYCTFIILFYGIRIELVEKINYIKVYDENQWQHNSTLIIFLRVILKSMHNLLICFIYEVFYDKENNIIES